VYKFIHEEPAQEDVHGFKTTHHTNRIEFNVDDDASLDEMCDAFQHFLMANGYSFDGNVEIVPNEEDELRDYKAMQQDITELNGDGNRERGRYGEDTHDYNRKSLWDATPREWDAAAKKLKDKNKFIKNK
jgi:hypothetical protein